MDFLTSSELAERWNISRRRVSTLCQSGRIEGAFLKGNVWLIPANAERPFDHRHENKGRTKKND